jgi:uncharacterized DUF497 family protein
MFIIRKHLPWNYNAMILLPPLRVIWDLDNDEAGNVRHIAEHGITKHEVEDVLKNPECIDTSRSTGRSIAIAEASTGRVILVVFEEVDDLTVYPVTAYEIED